MLKIYLANNSEQAIGGGWTFLRNLQKGIGARADFTCGNECDIFFISGVTMVAKGDVQEAKKLGKKVVLRIDNMPRKSRNRGMTPHARMRDYASLADAVVFQSKWARDWIGGWLEQFVDQKKFRIIGNGVDTEVFTKRDREARDYKKFLIVRYNRDENKRFEEACDMFTQEWMENQKHELYIVGKFSDELREANFDFWRGEEPTYIGIIEDRKRLASLMQDCDMLLYPSYSDALPNAVIEATACGMEVWHGGYAGIPEAIALGEKPYSIRNMADDYLQLFSALAGSGN